MARLHEEGACKFHEVWSWNLRPALALLAAALPSAIVALDVEFPGCLRSAPRDAPRTLLHEVMCHNVDMLQPIQLGLALVAQDGAVRGVWTFNLRFDEAFDLHNEDSLAFLRAAGVNLARHATQGIDMAELGSRLSELLLACSRAPHSTQWVTFSGLHDLGYFLKVLTSRRLPRDLDAFEAALAQFCPQRFELRDWLPHGSLASLAEQHGLTRRGNAHTAGSDALVTLELFLYAARARGGSLFQDANWLSSPLNAGTRKESRAAGARTHHEEVDQGAVARPLGMAGAKAAFPGSPGASRSTPSSSRGSAGHSPLPMASWGAAARWAMVGSLAGAGLGWATPNLIAGSAVRALPPALAELETSSRPGGRRW